MRTLEIARGGPVRQEYALVHRGEAYLTAAARALRAAIIEVTGDEHGVPRRASEALARLLRRQSAQSSPKVNVSQ